MSRFCLDLISTSGFFQVDSIACGGIDQLTEKVPQLKDATPKLIEDTKVRLLVIMFHLLMIESSDLCDLL